MRQIRKILAALLCLALCACSMFRTPSYTIDYDSSSLYTQQDMDLAIRTILREFDTWEGCEMHAIRYGGDFFCSQEKLDWLNILEPERTFTECICFFSDFRSPVTEGGDGAWALDFEYTDWQWWLARENGGPWVLVDWGYG